MLNDREIEFRYREYTKEPLTVEEIRTVLAKLGIAASEVLRVRDRAFREAALTGEEVEDELIEAMAKYPTLLQRPIGVYRGKAVLGRPVERLLEILT